MIRPLAYVEEWTSRRWADAAGVPDHPCNLCGSQDNLKRREVKQLIRDWERRHPGRVDSIFSALSRVVPSHLMDRERFDFTAVAATGSPDRDGDLAFDDGSPG